MSSSFFSFFSRSCIFLIKRRQVFGYVVNLGLAVLVIIWSLPLFVFVAIGIAYVYSKFFIAYTNTARDIRRIESVLRSPIFSSFAELLDGVVSVRAFGEERRFLINCTKRLDRATAAYWYMWMRWVAEYSTRREIVLTLSTDVTPFLPIPLFFSSSRWLLFRYDIIGAFATFVASVLALSGGSELSARIAILSLLYSDCWLWLCLLLSFLSLTWYRWYCNHSNSIPHSFSLLD